MVSGTGSSLLDVATRNVASVQTKEYDELLRLLRETREQANISQDRLSKSLGRARTFSSKIESGSRRVDVIEFIEIAKELGANPEDLFASLLKRIRSGR